MRPPVSYTVRRIRPDEADTLREFRLQALADAPEAFSQTLNEAEREPPSYWRQLAERGAEGTVSVTFFGELGGVWAGMVGGVVWDDGTPALVAMWVKPEHRRRRLALQLVQAVQDWARSLGHPSLRLWVAKGNERAAALYRLAGFAPTGRTHPLKWRPDIIEVEMAVELDR